MQLPSCERVSSKDSPSWCFRTQLKLSVPSVHVCGLWVLSVFLGEIERCWRNYRVCLLLLKSWIWRNSQWPGDTIALTTSILVSKAECKLVFTWRMETELILDIFSRMAIAKWPYHHGEGNRLNSVCCCSSSGNAAAAVLSLWIYGRWIHQSTFRQKILGNILVLRKT